LLATLPTAVLGAVVLVILSALGRYPGLVGDLVVRNKDATVWATIEATRPPFFKSFMEIVITPTSKQASSAIDLVTYAVSGFEREADHPVVIDHVQITLTGD
jgi:hypothetical protein